MIISSCEFLFLQPPKWFRSKRTYVMKILKTYLNTTINEKR